MPPTPPPVPPVVKRGYLLYLSEQREPLMEMWDPYGQTVLCQAVGQGDPCERSPQTLRGCPSARSVAPTHLISSTYGHPSRAWLRISAPSRLRPLDGRLGKGERVRGAWGTGYADWGPSQSPRTQHCVRPHDQTIWVTATPNPHPIHTGPRGVGIRGPGFGSETLNSRPGSFTCK